MLRLRDGHREVRLRVSGGHIVGVEARGRPEPERLLSRLVRAGLVEPDQRSTVLTQQEERESVSPVGLLLSKEQLIDQERLREVLGIQLRDTVMDLFLWEEGSFEFRRQAVGRLALGPEPVRIEHLLMDGVALRHDWEKIIGDLPHPDQAFEATGDLPEPAPDVVDFDGELSSTPPGEDFDEVDRATMDLVRGVTTLNELNDQAKLDRFQIGRSVAKLISAGYLALVDEVVSTDTLDEDAKLAAVVQERLEALVVGDEPEDEPQTNPMEMMPSLGELTDEYEDEDDEGEEPIEEMELITASIPPPVLPPPLPSESVPEPDPIPEPESRSEPEEIAEEEILGALPLPEPEPELAALPQTGAPEIGVTRGISKELPNGRWTLGPAYYAELSDTRTPITFHRLDPEHLSGPLNQGFDQVVWRFSNLPGRDAARVLLARRDDSGAFIALEKTTFEGLTPPLEGGLLLALARAGARSIGTLHDLLLFHGRLRPQSFGDRDGRPVLIDIHEAMLSEVAKVQDGDWWRYASPERLAGGKLDAAMDIYAFGALLYALVLGAPPYDADSREALVAAQAAGEPDLTQLAGSDAPAQVKETIERCLKLDPKERPYSLHQVNALLAPQV